jgi:hypothetical protein
MLKDLGRFTPHQLLDKLGLVVHKTKPDLDLVTTTINNLPVTNKEKLTIHGYGDWSRGRSSGGSVVLSDTNYVLKIPLGQQLDTLPPLAKAKELANTAKKFKDFAPETGFFIAQVDGPNEPAKVVICQKKNQGKPACDTSFDRLLLPEVSMQFVTIIDRLLKVLQTENLLDGIGVHLNSSNLIKRIIIRGICGLPFISDNFMVDENNQVELVDNVPALEAHRITNPIKKAVNHFRLSFSKQIVKWSSQTHSFLKSIPPRARRRR